MATREFFRFIRENSIATGPDIFDSNPIPNGQNRTISRVILSDQNIGDNKSGGFRLAFGNPGSFDTIVGAFVTGNVVDIRVDRQFTGNGTKVFRLIRQNLSATNKFMVVIVEGFIRSR